jgi:hypothetical protein
MGELFKCDAKFAHELKAEIKLLVPKLDFLWKHDGCHKPIAMPRVKR